MQISPRPAQPAALGPTGYTNYGPSGAAAQPCPGSAANALDRLQSAV
jgi:hypothetical protein